MPNDIKNDINVSCLRAEQISSILMQMAQQKRLSLLVDFQSTQKLRDYLEQLKQSDDTNLLLRRLPEMAYLMADLSEQLVDWQLFLLNKLRSDASDLAMLAARLLSESLALQSASIRREFMQKHFSNFDYIKELISIYDGDVLQELLCHLLVQLTENEREFYIEKILEQTYVLTQRKQIFEFSAKIYALCYRHCNSESIKKDIYTKIKQIYIKTDCDERLAVLWQLYCFSVEDSSFQAEFIELIKESESELYQYIYDFIKAKYNSQCLYNIDVKALYHSNLKASLPTAVKLFQTEILGAVVADSDLFYLAMHYANMLKVSTSRDVLNAVATALIRLFPNLDDDWQSDIASELLGFLEREQSLNTRYIALVLGDLLAYINMQAYFDIHNEMLTLVKTGNENTVCLLLSSSARLLSSACLWHKKEKSLELLLTALAHYKVEISDSAYAVFAYLFKTIAVDDKLEIYRHIAKKIIDLSVEIKQNADLISSTVALSSIADFLSEFELSETLELLTLPEKVAFYPGSFDPFSAAHLECAKHIRDCGFEVYMAIDEFSWSKRMQPNKIRRQIVNMSIAAEKDIYVYPELESVNLANASDLERLRENFGERDVYLVMGADVLTGASAYQRPETAELLASFSHILFERKQQAGQELLEQRVQAIKGDVLRHKLSAKAEHISSTLIRNRIDSGKSIEHLVDPMVRAYIADNGLYRFEPMFKDTMTSYSTSVEVLENFSDELLQRLCEQFQLDSATLRALLSDRCHQEKTRILLIRELETDTIIAFSIFHWLRSSMIYHEFSSEEISDYVRENAVGRIVVIDALYTQKNQHIKKINQVVLTETLAFNLAKDYSFAIYKNAFNRPESEWQESLELQGFVSYSDDEQTIYSVNMTAPISFNLDLKTMLKAPFRDDELVNEAIEKARKRIQTALCQFYPGNLVLAFDRTMIYEHLVKLICTENNVAISEENGRQLGDNMLVTYGDLFKRWRIPNTVTKALHSERFYASDLSDYQIKNHPNYLSLDNQINTIASFKRPVILMDDLMDKGKRFKILAKEIKRHNIPIKSLVVAILTARGKAYMEMNNIDVTSAYYLPQIRHWFNESMLYPFIGGDAIDVDKSNAIDAFYAINKILPYTYAKHFKSGVSSAKVKQFSLSCLISAREILLALEKSYYQRHGRMLSLYYLSDVFISPRFVYKGKTHKYNLNRKASDYLSDDIASLTRIGDFYE